jgi:hypothetical protein
MTTCPAYVVSNIEFRPSALSSLLSSSSITLDVYHMVNALLNNPVTPKAMFASIGKW